ncbi:MAG: hypothetical protein WBE79_03170 [Candidatus Cybelea sp.]
MAAKKTPRKKTAKKSSAKRVTSKKPATSSVSKASRKTKQVARGAQNVGKIIGVIGNLVEAGGKAAEEITTKVDSGRRRASPKSGERLRQATKGTRNQN